jgi:cytochrome c oxidase accessory protein FixG
MAPSLDQPPAEPPTAAESPRPSAPVAPAALSTLNDDGSRRWLRPRPSPGRFLTARRLVAYALIALFAALPLIRIHGHPVVLLDIIARRFHIFGTTFYPTDTLLLALLLVAVFVLIFWTTALLGRVWCGWACPQTVYLEFVYRPIERFFEGAPGRAPKGWLQNSGARKPLKVLVYLLCSLILAHTFLAYFVSWHDLASWVFGSPASHPIGFAVVVFITAAMMFNFGYFREQVCLVACPYGRLQSVMLDRHSLIVRYDVNRGEPRGAKKASAQAIALPILTIPSPVAAASKALGDCIDCHMCVTTCPTGIDIRNGLQMECVGCAQCIDACDSILDKIGRARGLIRYSSEAAARNERFRFLRPRVIVYPAILLVLIVGFAIALLNTGIADATLLRGFGQPFIVSPDSMTITNPLRIKIVNRLDHPAEFTVSLDAASAAPGLSLAMESPKISVRPGEMTTTPAQVIAPPTAFQDGRHQTFLIVIGPDNYTARLPFMLLGPRTFEKHESSAEHKDTHP